MCGPDANAPSLVPHARAWATYLYPMVAAAVREVSVPDPDMDAFCGRLEDIAELCDDLREAIEEGLCHVQTRVRRTGGSRVIVTKTCCECGHLFGSRTYDGVGPSDHVPDEIELPRYCPGCGGRVVEP